MRHFICFFTTLYNQYRYAIYHLTDNNATILKQLRSSKDIQLKSQLVKKRKGQISFKLTEAPKDLLPVTLEINVEKGIQRTLL